MDYETIVRDTAVSLDLLDAAGQLKKLDSLAMIDFITALEESSRVTIPTSAISLDAFQSLDAVTELVKKLAA